MSTIKNVCMANLWPELTILRLGQWDFYRLGWCLVQQIIIQETHVICVLRRCRLEVTLKLWKPETGIMLSFTSSWPHWETGLDWSPSLPGTDTVFFLWQDNIPPTQPFPVSLWWWGGGGGEGYINETETIWKHFHFPHLHNPFSLSLISLMVSVDIKHHVYYLKTVFHTQ